MLQTAENQRRTTSGDLSTGWNASLSRGWSWLLGVSTPARHRALGMATVGIWLADFAVMMSRALIRGHPDALDVAVRRAIVCLFGLFACQLIYRLLDRHARPDPGSRLAASIALSGAGALAYAAVNAVAFYVIVPRWGAAPFGMAGEVALVFGIHIWVYLACVTVFWIVRYSDELTDRERRLAEARRLMLDAQNRMLRYQINPHFLFNTLNALSTLILQGDNRNAERMVLGLSEFLRRSLEKDPVAKVSLAEEIAMAREYLAIEQLRFGDRLTLRIIAPEELLDARVPSLILQPLVENAVKFGVSNCSRTVAVEISARAHASRLMLGVRDDGPGVAGDEVTLGLGLRNVRDRLNAIYGEAGRVEWGPTEPRGFAVSVEFTLERHDHAA